MGTGRSRIDQKSKSPSGRQLPSLSYDVMCMPAVTDWGPLGATVVTSFDDFKEKFGGFLASYYGAVHVKRFFDLGGRRCIISRIMHWDANGDPETGAKASATAQTGAGSPTYGSVTGTETAPFNLAAGDTVVVSVQGDPDQTATLAATRASVVTGIGEVYALWDTATIQIAIDGGVTQIITFNTADFADITQATAEEVANAINLQLVGGTAVVTDSGTTVTVYSDTYGTDSSVNVVEVGGGMYGTDANSVLTFPTATASGTGDVPNAASVTVSDLETWLEGALTGIAVEASGSNALIRTTTAGASGSIQVQASSTADTKIGWDNLLHTGTSGAAADTLGIEALYYGSKGNNLSYAIEDASDGSSERFDLVIYLSSTIEERYRNMTMDSTNTEKYAVNAINLKAGKSLWIRVTDEGAAGSTAQRRPANATATSLTGGDDGLTDLAVADYTGTAALQTGLHSFTVLREGDVLICPDQTGSTMQNACIDYCATTRKGLMVFIPVAPVSSDSEGAVTAAQSLTASESATAMLWPWIKVPNPDKDVYGQGDTITISPDSSLCGRMAKNSQDDTRKKMWRQPGNEVYGLLDGASGLETNEVIEPDVQDYVTDNGINPVVAGIRWTDNRYGVWVNDVQALLRTGNFKSVGNIRGVAYLRKQFEAFLDQERTQTMSEDWRRQIKRTFDTELIKWTQAGVFASLNAQDAFYTNADVKGENLNNPLVQNNETFKILVALAVGEAGRFMEIWFTKDQRAVESFIQQQLSATSIA
jgi:hypothetical protein